VPIALFLPLMLTPRTIIVQNLLFVFLIVFVATGCGQGPSNSLPVSKVPDSSILYPADFTFSALSPAEADVYKNEVDAYYKKHLLASGFNGAILVAKNGEIVFEEYKGFINFKTKEAITAETPFHLASISKTFTGMTILRLWEQGRLSLDDDLLKYFPNLPYHGVTIKMLLSHRTGLPNYLNFMDSFWNRKQRATNQDVVDYMVAHKPRVEGLPGRSYHYNNTNFMLLALVIEKITHQPYPQYMKDSVFTPLGLKNTYVFSSKDTPNYVPTYIGSRPYPMDHLDCTYGDKNIYSTVRDLLLWDKALYQHTFVKASTSELAFTPQSFEHKGMRNYGLGWHLFLNSTDTIVYHNGKWHGENNTFARLVQQKATIIVLGNKQNANIFAAKNMSTIFTSRADTTRFEE
jgi:CubicO group peptidase (beta-lactamase class C family)